MEEEEEEKGGAEGDKRGSKMEPYWVGGSCVFTAGREDYYCDK